MSQRLLELVWRHDELAQLDAPARRLALRALVAAELGEDDVSTHVARLVETIDGYGSLSSAMSDEHVTDILVNGPHEVWIERSGTLERTTHRFASEQDLRAFVDRLLGRSGVRADASHPIASARLPDGSRLHVVLPPVAPAGPLVSIRRAPRRPLTLADLVDARMLDAACADRLRDYVVARRSILVSGATGTGKTTLLNALLAHVPARERVVTVEETPELVPACAHRVALVAREPNPEGRGLVDLTMLVRAALRMRPDRIVVGEVRGAEALAALQAMSTGHEGSLLTVHASSADDALRRLVTLALQGSSGASEGALEDQVGRAVDVVAHLERTEGGARRVSALRLVD